jgi:hypothetical protein
MSKQLTDSQLDAVTIVIDEQTGEQFYLVESATDITVTYQVRFNRHFARYSCQCKGNAAGYICWHMRAALQVGRQHAEEKRAEAEAAARIAEEQAEYERLMHARPYRPSEKAVKAAQKRNEPQGFSLLR